MNEEITLTLTISAKDEKAIEAMMARILNLPNLLGTENSKIVISDGIKEWRS